MAQQVVSQAAIALPYGPPRASRTHQHIANSPTATPQELRQARASIDRGLPQKRPETAKERELAARAKMANMMAPGGFATTKVCRHDDCADEAGNVRDEYSPCTPHPEAAAGGAAARLQRVGFWSDRPHFATRRAYDERVFPLVQPTARVAPEQVFIRRVKRDTGLWVYGERGKMRHDLHEGGDARTRGRSQRVQAC